MQKGCTLKIKESEVRCKVFTGTLKKKKKTYYILVTFY